MQILYLIVAPILAFVAGYLTCLWWGKPAKILKVAAEEGIDVIDLINRKMR